MIIRNLADRNKKGADTEVVDGQQRLTTIYEFTQGGFSINDELSKRIVRDNADSYEFDIANNAGKETEAIKFYKKFKKGQKVSLTYGTLSSLMKADFDSYNMALHTFHIMMIMLLQNILDLCRIKNACVQAKLSTPYPIRY